MREAKLWMLALLLAGPLLAGFTLPGEYARLIDAGNRLYARAKFKEAAEKYDAALKVQPDAPDGLFNRGAASYRTGEFDKAHADFAKAATTAEGQLKEHAEYNAGNCAYRQQKFDEAIACYKRALTLDPNDQWAKHNLEMALRKQQEKQQQQQQQSREKQPDKQQGAQQQRQRQPEQQNAEGGAQPEQQNAEAQQRRQEGSAVPLTPEQAAQLLSSLAQEDAEMQKIVRRMPLTRERPTGKDW